MAGDGGAGATPRGDWRPAEDRRGVLLFFVDEERDAAEAATGGEEPGVAAHQQAVDDG